MMLLAAAFLALGQAGGCAAMSPEARERALASIEEDTDRAVQPHGDGLWIGGIAFAADDVVVADVSQDSRTDQWVVTITFSPAGNARFVAAQQCQLDHRLEISVDGRLIVRPFLNEPILGGQAVLQGGWNSREEAAAAAARILQRP